MILLGFSLSVRRQREPVIPKPVAVCGICQTCPAGPVSSTIAYLKTNMSTSMPLPRTGKRDIVFRAENVIMS